jgi:protoporphyrinogen oxidase
MVQHFPANSQHPAGSSFADGVARRAGVGPLKESSAAMTRPRREHGDGRRVVVVGAGPAGLTAAYQLVARREPTVVLDQDTRVGGIAQTGEYKGFRFDLGGHRFFTKVALVQDLWRTLLGDDLLKRPRLSRIYYRGRFFDYPLKPLNALRNLGVGTSIRVVLSYAWAQLRPVRPEVSFADWVTNRFGRCLYRIFFETYTQKVWGLPCHAIGAQWAAQRIKGLSLFVAVRNMLFPRLDRGRVKTLIDEFEYPRRGPGQMWEACRDRILEGGGDVQLGSRVERLRHDGARITSVEGTRAGEPFAVAPSAVISSMPMRHLIRALDPPPPPDVIAAADRLRYRDFITVALIVDEPSLFPDNWIYIHDEAVRVGRIQNFKNWSPDMVPDPGKTCLGLEYFCFEGDGLWTMSDEALVSMAAGELTRLGLARRDLIVDGCVARMPKAYPIYDATYAEAVDVLKAYLQRFGNLQLVGRNGMHKYNNQDHSMLTAILAVENLFGAAHDLWAVNADEEYHEESAASGADVGLPAHIRDLARTQPRVPALIATDATIPASGRLRAPAAASGEM